MGPDRSVEQNRLSLSKMAEGFVPAFCAALTAAYIFEIADRERYIQVISDGVVAPAALALCVAAGLANALRARHVNRLSRG